MAARGSRTARWAKVLMASGGGLAVLAPLVGFTLGKMLATPPTGGTGSLGSRSMEAPVDGLRNGILVIEGSILLAALGVLALLAGLGLLLWSKHTT